MAVYKVQTPDGKVMEIEGPDGATDEQLIAVAQRELAAARPDEQFATPVVDRQPTGTGLQAGLIGAGDFASGGLLDEIEAGLRTVLPGQDSYWSAPDGRSFRDQYDLNLQQANGAKQAILQDRPGAYAAGTMGGILATGAIGGALGVPNALARVPLAGRAIAADALAGAAYGAGNENDDRVKGAATGAVVNALGGVAGRSAVRGVANALAPVVPAAVRTLSRAGVTMTPGQVFGQGGIVGRTIKGLEDRAAGFPIVGDLVGAARRGGVEDFNRAAVKEALAPIGEQIPPNTAPGRQMIDYAQEKASDAYDKALTTMHLQADDHFAEGMRDINAGIEMLEPDIQGTIKNALKRHVAPFVGETMDGASLQDIKQGLTSEAVRLRQGAPSDVLAADALDMVRNEFMDLASRQAPVEAADYRAADAAYARMSIINRAASKDTKDGVFSPNQLSTAVRQGDRSSGKRGYAAGRANLQELADAGSQVLPSTVPDSGTAGRVALYAAAGGGGLLGAGGSDMSGGDVGANALAGLAVAGVLTPAGRRAIQALAIDRPDALLRLGDRVRQYDALGGVIGSGLALGSLGR